MRTYISVFVGEDFVTTIFVNENPRQAWLDYLYAVSNNPVVVNLTNSPMIPSEGMAWDGTSFSASSPDQTFTLNNLSAETALFAFIVDGIYVASHSVFAPAQPDLVAAYQSSPRFEVSVGE